MSKFYNLTVVDLKEETKNAKVVTFGIPESLQSVFSFKPGQFLTLMFVINNEEQRRCYSVCSSPISTSSIQVGVKRVKNGIVSNYINDTLKIGDEVSVMRPSGNFFADIKKDNYKSYYLFASGSGITPVLSILRTVLTTEEQSYVYMIYGNRTIDSVMFKAELEKLQNDYVDRFTLVNTFSKPKSSWSDLWTNNSLRKGRVDAKSVQWFINEYPPYAQNTQYYICGPGTMISTVSSTLQNMDVPNKRIFKENFGGDVETLGIEGVENAVLKARLNGQEIKTVIPKQTTLLRALIANGGKPPYSCEGGVCSTCKCKLVSGKVHMLKNFSLEEKELKENYILSCQSIPLSETVEVVYE